MSENPLSPSDVAKQLTAFLNDFPGFISPMSIFMEFLGGVWSHLDCPSCGTQFSLSLFEVEQSKEDGWRFSLLETPHKESPKSHDACWIGTEWVICCRENPSPPLDSQPVSNN